MIDLRLIDFLFLILIICKLIVLDLSRIQKVELRTCIQRDGDAWCQQGKSC